MAKSDADGRFVIKNLPVGRHQFQLWHERIGYLRDLKIGSLSTDAKGRLTLEVQAGDNVLPDGRLNPDMFELPSD